MLVVALLGVQAALVDPGHAAPQESSGGPALVRGPYLQLGTPTAVTVRWRTDLAAASRVRYGTAPGSLNRQVFDASQLTEHELRLEGLEPSTRYYYAVGTAQDDLIGGDGALSFTTAPPRGMPVPVRIWVLGDSGTRNTNARAVRDAYAAWSAGLSTDLWLMLGDNAYPAGTDPEYQDAVFDMYPDMLRSAVLWPTIGNHDTLSASAITQTGVYFDIFTLPTAGEAGGVPSGTEAYYSFDWANVHFVVLDSQDLDRSPDAPMLEWLAQDLAVTTQDWIVAYWHHPPYSKGSHDSDFERPLIEMRQWAVPLLEDWGVDLVLTGHSHSYERSWLIDGHYGDSTTWSDAFKVAPGSGDDRTEAPYAKPDAGTLPHSGTVYAVAGSSGQISGGPLDHPAMVRSLNILGSLVLEVSANRLVASFLDTQGEVADRFTMVKGSADTPPIAAFTAATTVGVAPLSVQFTDLSESVPLSWEWDFEDDGAIDSVLRNPVHEYRDPGQVSVRLRVGNLAGEDEELKVGLICVTSASPARITGLRFAGAPGRFEWDSPASGSTYDVLRGDLDDLRVTQGAFASAAVACIDDDGIDTEATDAANPSPGTGFFYLVRSVDCTTRAGSYDSAGSGQVAPRDVPLQGSPAVCSCSAVDDPDGDRFCGVWDNCPDLASSNPGDADADGAGDACDPCPLDALDDADADGRCADVDNCPMIANPAQADGDADGLGDACDGCPADPANDIDGDGRCADVDNCPLTPNADQADFDGDGLGDLCDACPTGDNIDFDGDGLCTRADNCPQVANPDQADGDGDGIGDACDPCVADPANDADTDFVCGDEDNCPAVANFDQADFDGDGTGDVCDPDDDDDGVSDATDCMPFRSSIGAVPDPIGSSLRLSRVASGTARLEWNRSWQSHVFNVYRGTATIGFAWAYDLVCAEGETTATGFTDDNVPPSRRMLYYLIGARNACGESAAGFDGGGSPVRPEALCPAHGGDADGDAQPDLLDNCSGVANPDQADADHDFVGDACDNCPQTFNPTQADADRDGTGDVCD